MDNPQTAQGPNYQQLFQLLPSPYIVMAANDPVFTIVGQNDAHATISFTKRQSVIGQPVLQAFPDTSEEYKITGVSSLIESFRRVIKTGEKDTMPLLRFDIQSKKGTFVERWWRVTHYPFKDANGIVTTIAQSTEDVTHEVETSKQLAKTQTQLDSALDIGLVSTWYLDIKKDLLTGDKNLARNFGIKPELAAKGLPLQIFINSIHPDDQDRIVAAVQKTIAEKGVYEEEYRTIDQKGIVRWVIARGRVQCDATNNPEGFSGVLVDITARKEAETSLERTKSMFNALFESKILSIAMADLRGNVLEANQKFLKTLGYTKADMKRGINSSNLTPIQSKHKTVNIYDELRKTGQIEPTEKEYVRKDGKIVPMMVGGAMLPNSKNLFMAFMLDISENKELKALNIAKDEFIALASHQLRTPATAVKQYLGILIDEFAGPVTADQLQYLNIAYNSNERQLNIINDLLKTAQLDTKGYRLILTKHNINEIIREIADEFSAVFDSKKQQFVFKPTSPHIEALVDVEEIKLALTNLIENASKYTPNGKSITVQTSKTKHHVTVSVVDEGVGIAKKDQNVIFEKFTRVNNVLSDTVNGSGLGLYWVKRIVSLHGGQLFVTSEVGKGTTFAIRLQA